MECQCTSKRAVSISAKCSDMFNIELHENSKEHDGYVPKDIGIGGGDYIRFSYCLDCGKIQGNFPLEQAELEMEEDEDE